MNTPKPFLRQLVASAIAMSMFSSASVVRADPVPIPDAHLQFTAPAGWVASEMRGPQFAMFNRGTAATVQIMIPAVDATHTEASLEAEFLRMVRPRWRGQPAVRMFREARGSMRRGQCQSNGHAQSCVWVTARVGARFMMAAIFLEAGSTPADEQAAQQLIDSAQPIP